MGENRYFIAIAGAAGAGKTTVSKIIKDRGFHVVFTDQNVREALNSLPVIKELEKYIGSGIFGNGKLNFKKISAYFEDHYEDECRFEEWFQPYYGKQIIEQLNQTKEKIVFFDIHLLFYKRIEEYFYSIWWLDSDFLVENIRNRNHYNDRKILNLIQFSSKNKRMPNCCVIQNNSSIEALKTKIDKEIEKLMEEITFSEVVNDVLLALNEKTKIEFQHVICPDIIVGLNGEFWFDKQSRIEHQDQLKIKAKTESEKTIVVLLESPHVDEFQDSKISPNPALKTTGTNLQKYFTDKSLHNLLGKNFSKEYRVILMNSIQYQCSLGLDTEKYRDHIWISCWYKFGRESFINRLASYNPDIIINLCTNGNHSKEPDLPSDCHNIDKKYLKYCLKEYFDKQSELKNLEKTTLTLKSIVSACIRTTFNNSIILYEGTHPCSWRSNFDSIHIKDDN